MARRLGREDFDKTSELMGGRGPGNHMWGVCQEYELRELPGADEQDDLQYELVPKYPSSVRKERWKTYEPLEETPDLFLRFARLYDKGDSIEAIVDWVHRYGVLGDNPDAINWTAAQSVRSFRQESGKAAGILALYEAVLNGDGDRAKSVVLEDYPFVGGARQMHMQLGRLCRECVNREIMVVVEEVYDGDFLSYAWTTVVEDVNAVVRRRCRPFLVFDAEVPDPTKVRDRWTFIGLLGGMYLQMYWLIAAGGNVTRCDYCGRIISLARPGPGARKPPQHKRFCDKACRQSYHYHNKVKPKRQGGRPV